jgi:hypothetical protein
LRSLFAAAWSVVVAAMVDGVADRLLDGPERVAGPSLALGTAGDLLDLPPDPLIEVTHRVVELAMQRTTEVPFGEHVAAPRHLDDLDSGTGESALRLVAEEHQGDVAGHLTSVQPCCELQPPVDLGVIGLIEQTRPNLAEKLADQARTQVLEHEIRRRAVIEGRFPLAADELLKLPLIRLHRFGAETDVGPALLAVAGDRRGVRPVFAGRHPEDQ